MATKAFDLSKFRKTLTKSIDGLGVGFNDPTDWVSTGNYALNYLISADFNKGIPLGKVTVFAGESGAGKSYVCSGNLIRNAQEQGIYVILVDSENALDEKWLHALGVDTSEQKLLKLNMAMINAIDDPTELGLRAIDRKIIMTMLQRPRYRGRSAELIGFGASENDVCLASGVDKGEFRDVIRPRLMTRGLIEVRPGIGLALTDRAIKHYQY